ncbi:type II 3-dehydroquinate dehydratase [Bradyrhizobium prioriisuperbiae]|uniref:type II 3-dehydroquinate dehydratase n=1 Tax=Bradyrhizobium prioriisuperbiae TaxID=2854389 RepID=UPI0028E50B65|nr:type II 3-dehydroquinate dehydratase [Bradyrhizobium prioritasuperba]
MSDKPVIYFINGPNANLYGLDAAGTYGPDSFATLENRCQEAAQKVGLQLKFLQSNHEGKIVDWIQEARGRAAAIAINATGLTYTSVSILGALAAFSGPIIEVHMGNIWKREAFRHHSYVSRVATGVIAGLGVLGYEAAITIISQLVERA